MASGSGGWGWSSGGSWSSWQWWSSDGSRWRQASAVAEEDPYSEPPAAPAAALAIEDAAPVPAVAVAPPLPQWRLPLQYVAPVAAVAETAFVAALALEDAAPVAAVAAGAQPANDGQPDPQVFDLNYFRSFRPYTGGWKQHNAALKYFRAQQELDDDPLQSPCLQFHVSTPAAVAAINHAAKGMTWEFSDEMTEWSWHEMVAQLEDAWMEEVVTGPSGRSGGLVGCSFAIRPGSYDHKRHHMLRQTTTTPPQHKLPYWDFVVHREDGSGVRLHPEWSRPFVEAFEEPGHGEALAVVTVPPRRGLGRSDGRGTYVRYKNAAVSKKMRFDPSKKP